MPIDAGQIPPQALAALQQSGAQGGDITEILAQLAQMSPEEVSQALAQLGVQIDPETLHAAAEQWVDQAAEDASGNAATPDTEGADRTRGVDPADQEEEAEGEGPGSPPATPAEEDAEGEGENAEIPAGARPTGYSGGVRAGAAAPAAGGAAMPRSQVTGPPIPSGGAGGTMDDLVSAAMMQRATGNPNAAVPSVGGTGNVGMPRAASAIPNPRPSGAPNNPRMAAMIADLYRSTGGKTGKRRTPSAAPSKR